MLMGEREMDNNMLSGKMTAEQKASDTRATLRL